MAASELEIGQRFRDCPGCPEMVVVPAGTFTMGSPASEAGRQEDEGPMRQVHLSEAFAVGVHEVTFGELEAICGEGHAEASGRVTVRICRSVAYVAHDEGWGTGSRPAMNVGWRGVQMYLDRLREKTGKPYRLLTEAEWEYAARGGTQTAFFIGDTISTAWANYNGNYAYGSSRGSKYQYEGKTVAVGTFRPNAFGLHDMHGNVWEWVADCGGGSVATVPKDGRARLGGDCTNRVLRGGSWLDKPEVLRSANRLEVPGGKFPNVGFRVALTLATDENCSTGRCQHDDRRRGRGWPFSAAEELDPTVPSELRRIGASAGLEAAILADHILEKESDDLVFDVERRELLIGEIRQVLARIREAYPGLEAVGAHRRHQTRTLVFSFEPDFSKFLELTIGLTGGVWEDIALPRTGYEAFDSLNVALGLRGVEWFCDLEDLEDGRECNALFYYSKHINTNAAIDAYEQVAGIADVRTNSYPAFGGPDSDVSASKADGVWHVHFLVSSGDCPAGCIHVRNYDFTVENGKVSLVEAAYAGDIR